MTQLLTPTSDPQIFELEVDNTSKELYETCARAAEYYSVKKRELASERPALNYGGIIHKALVPRKLQLPDWQTLQEQIIVTEFGKSPAPVDDWRTAERALQTVQLYNKQWPIDAEPFTFIADTVEQSFRLKLGRATLDSTIAGQHVGAVDIFWTGRIDGLITYDNQTLVLDHKTTSMLGASFYDDFVLSSQMHGYVWAARRSGHAAKGLLLDVLASRKPTRTRVGNEFQRQRYFYSEEHLAEWERDMFQHVCDFLEHLCEGYFPKSTKWCQGKYGQCQYFSVCSQLPQHRDTLLYSDVYRDVTWSPLNDRQTNPQRTANPTPTVGQTPTVAGQHVALAETNTPF